MYIVRDIATGEVEVYVSAAAQESPSVELQRMEVAPELQLVATQIFKSPAPAFLADMDLSRFFPEDE